MSFSAGTAKHPMEKTKPRQKKYHKVTAAGFLIKKNQPDTLVLSHPLTVAVPHPVAAPLLKGKSQRISNLQKHIF